MPTRYLFLMLASQSFRSLPAVILMSMLPWRMTLWQTHGGRKTCASTTWVMLHMDPRSLHPHQRTQWRLPTTSTCEVKAAESDNPPATEAHLRRKVGVLDEAGMAR